MSNEDTPTSEEAGGELDLSLDQILELIAPADMSEIEDCYGVKHPITKRPGFATQRKAAKLILDFTESEAFAGLEGAAREIDGLEGAVSLLARQFASNEDVSGLVLSLFKLFHGRVLRAACEAHKDDPDFEQDDLFSAEVMLASILPFCLAPVRSALERFLVLAQ